MSEKLLIEAAGIAIVWLLSWKMRSVKSRQILFLASSYVFYASFALWFLAILIASSLTNYAWGSFLRRRPTAGRLWGGVLLNVSLLGVFKYIPGLADTWAGHSLIAARLAEIALPVGISFWTFEALSYLLDIYRDPELDPSLLEFCLYMAFGPTVLSGPICRLPEMLPQFRAPNSRDWSAIKAGLQRIWLGLFLMTAARILGSGFQVGQGVDAGFAIGNLGSIDVWLLVVGYGFQLLFDFAGYSHIVIGIAVLFGFRLPENFDLPYLSTSPAEFWTRWHMSLSFWIRDYVFLPLATVRREIWWRNLSLVISMVIFGLWHKAGLLFIVWGAYHGILLVFHRLWQQTSRKFGFTWSGWHAMLVSWAVTFAAVSFGWIFFRSPSMQQALAMIRAALSPVNFHVFKLSREYYMLVGITAVGYFLVSMLSSVSTKREAILSWIPVELRFACYAAMLYLIIFHAAQPQAFIYFQF